jgi:hypothetical protein
VRLLPQPHTIEEVVYVFKVAFVSHAIHAHLIVTIFLDEFFVERRFRKDIRVIVLPGRRALPFVAE